MAKLVNLYLDGKFPISTNRLNHFDRLFGQALFGGVEKSVDYAPIISINDALAKPAIELLCKITAIQEGSGDPSPQNIRNIVGWNGLTLHVNSSEIPITWQTEAGTVYGGVLNVTTGTLTVTHEGVVLDGSENWNDISGSRGYYLAGDWSAYVRTSDILCTCLVGSGASSSSSMAINSIMLNSNKTNLLCRLDTTNDFPTVDDWKYFLSQNNMVVLFPLVTPQTYTLTPTEITLLAGANTLWSDTGDSKMTYMAKR